MASNSTVCAHNVSTNTLNVVTGIRKPVLTVTSATTLTADQGGSFVVLGAVGAAIGSSFNIDLPPPERGLEYVLFIAGTDMGGNTITVTSNSHASTAANLIIALRICGSADDASVASVADIITFDTPATTGDHVHLSCDGTNWFARIIYDVDNAVTLA